MDRLNAMQLFVRVAELGSFAGVAAQLNQAPSVVTRQIAALESHLGCKLLERSTRSLRLTGEGAAYLEKCRLILNLVESAETDIGEARHVPRGAIRVSMPLVYGLRRVAPLMLAFAERYPEVELDMDFSDRRQNLIEEGLDLSLRITPRLAPGDVVRKLGASRMKVAASPDYLARHGRPAQPDDLAHHAFLGYTHAQTGALDFVIDGRPHAVPLRSRIKANNGMVLAEAAVLGMGIACEPDFIIDEFLADGRLEEILSQFTLPELGIYALLPSNRQVPYRVRLLMDFLAQSLGQTSAPSQ